MKMGGWKTGLIGMHGDDLERETGMKMGMGGMRMVVSKKKDGYGDGWHDGWV